MVHILAVCGIAIFCYVLYVVVGGVIAAGSSGWWRSPYEEYEDDRFSHKVGPEGLLVGGEDGDRRVIPKYIFSRRT